MTESLKRVSMVLLALAITLVLSGVLTLGVTNNAKAGADKVFVCKYVGKPGVDERLQTGQNPISVSINSIKDYPGIGGYFADAQNRSLVVALDEGQEEPECPTPDVPKKISPILECVETLGEGSYEARFGYLNNNPFVVNIPVGSDNKITGGGLAGQDQGQTTEFQSGRAVDDFRVEFDGSNLVWTLAYAGKRSTATASSTSKACPEEPQYFFQFDKEWEGDEVDLDDVQVVFKNGEGKEWSPGDKPIEVEPGQVLTGLTEEVTGLPTTCTYESDLPMMFTVPQNTDEFDESNTYTLEVTNTIDCGEPRQPVTPEGETETPVTTTTQVTATPTGAVDAGAGANLVASLAGLMSSAAVVAAGVFLRRFTVVSL